MSSDKTPKLKARLARGFVDRTAREISITRHVVQAIQEVFELHGFEPLETPFIEFTDALGKFLPDQDRPNEGVFSFQDDDEQWLSLRYDLTAPLARYVAENYDALSKPHRSYRAGYVFRNEKPGPGRFRQFMQFDADTVGAASVAADAEICMMAADTMEKLKPVFDRLGLKGGAYVVRVNNRKVLDGIMEVIGLAGEENAGRRLGVLRAIDKFDRLGTEGVRDLLGAGRLDESGAYTKGAGLDEAAIKVILDFVTGQSSSNAGTIERLAALVAGSALGQEGVAELGQINALVEQAGYGRDRIAIDTSIVRGLEYYTGPVYEVELTFDVKDEDGKPVRFGSVGGGGRYDGLVARFRSEPVPAAGFSIGVSRLVAALMAHGGVDEAGEAGPVVVCVMDKERLGDYQAMARDLREAGIRAEVYLGGSGMKAQLKYADRRRSPVAVIQGSDEAARGEVQLKDLALGAQMAKAIASNTEWREARVAQKLVARADLVAEVKAMLG